VSVEKDLTAKVSSRPALILFADLLGFSRRVEAANSEDDRSALAKLHNYFAEQFSGSDIEDADVRDFYAKRFWAFSDSIVIRLFEGSNAEQSMTKFDADLDQLSSIALAQFVIMDRHGQLIRGGVAQGWLLESDETVVGTALVKAARLEKAIEMPFIGVEPELYERYRNEPGRGHYSERLDPFPRVFIPPCPYTRNIPALDYLSVAYGEIDLTNQHRRDSRAIQDPEARDQFQNQCWNENHLSFIQWHRDFLTQGLKGSDPKVVQKYTALSQRHNWRVSQLYPGQEELLINGGQAIDLSGAPT
jgi:hypothetical protein